MIGENAQTAFIAGAVTAVPGLIIYFVNRRDTQAKETAAAKAVAEAKQVADAAKHAIEEASRFHAAVARAVSDVALAATENHAEMAKQSATLNKVETIVNNQSTEGRRREVLLTAVIARLQPDSETAHAAAAAAVANLDADEAIQKTAAETKTAEDAATLKAATLKEDVIRNQMANGESPKPPKP